MKMNETSTDEDRCRGVLIGLAAGDKIGGPIRMAVRLAESLVACGGCNPSDILERYLAWWREEAFDTGPVSDRAFALLTTGMPLQEATAQVHREFGGRTAGCNPAHRSPPLSMLAAIADEDLAALAMSEAEKWLSSLPNISCGLPPPWPSWGEKQACGMRRMASSMMCSACLTDEPRG
jgi:ADP-ribosylglycohydrolase